MTEPSDDIERVRPLLERIVDERIHGVGVSAAQAPPEPGGWIVTEDRKLPPDAPATRRGWRTSELWVTAVSALVAIANRKLGLELTEIEITALAGVAAAYIAGRVAVKWGAQ